MEGVLILLCDIVLPVFLIIISGWLLARFNLVSRRTSYNLTLYIFWTACPAVIFLAVSRYHIPQIFIWNFWLAYLASVFIVTLFTYYFFQHVFHETKITALTAALSTTIKNVIMIGFPILLGVVGTEATIPLAIIVIICNCLVAPLLMFAFELNATFRQMNRTREAFSVLFATARNPLVISALLGFVFSLFRFHLPLFIGRSLSYLAASFIPCSLFSVGIELKFFKLQGNFLEILIATLISLFVYPAVAIGFSYGLNLSPFYSTSLVIFSAVPTANLIYVYANKYRVFEKETATIVSITTIFSIATLPFYIYLCYRLWPAAFRHLVL